MTTKEVKVQYTTGKWGTISLPVGSNVSGYMNDPKHRIHKYQTSTGSYRFVSNLTPETIVHGYAIRNPEKEKFKFKFDPKATPTLKNLEAVKENLITKLTSKHIATKGKITLTSAEISLFRAVESLKTKIKLSEKNTLPIKVILGVTGLLIALMVAKKI